MFDWSKFVNLIKANVLNLFTPIIVLFILSRYTSNDDYAVFIGGYALVLVLTAIIDFGSRQVFMLSDDLFLQSSADALKTLIALGATIFFISFSLFNGYDRAVLLLSSLLWKDLLIPIYKFKQDLSRYNNLLFCSSIIVLCGAFLVVIYRDIIFIYLAFFISVLPAALFHRVQRGIYSIAGFIEFIKVSGSFAASNLLVGLSQNGAKILLLSVVNPTVLVGYEVVTKLANLGRYAINIIIEYLQVTKHSLSGKLLWYGGFLIQLIGSLIFMIIANLLEEYFQVNRSLIIFQTLIYFPLVLIGYYHKVLLVELNRTFLVLISVFTSTAAYLVCIVVIGTWNLFKLLSLSIVFEYSVFIITYFGILLIKKNDGLFNSR